VDTARHGNDPHGKHRRCLAVRASAWFRDLRLPEGWFWGIVTTGEVAIVILCLWIAWNR
jgi:hypothetical protein